MVELGVALVLVGAALLVVEAHVPAGVLGAAGGVTLAVGAALALSGAGAGAAAIIAAVLATCIITALWLGVVTRKALAAGGRRASSGREALGGRMGVVRNWDATGGQVYVDGALWRARRSPVDDDEEEAARRGRSGGRRERPRPDPRGPQSRGVGGTVIEVVLIVLVVVALAAVILAGTSIRVLREYERGVVFRLGRIIDQKGPGLILLIPAVDRMVRMSLRTVTLRIPHQEVITRDNVPVKVAAVVYFRVIDPTRSVVEVEDHVNATLQIAQTTLRSVLGKAELDTLLSERERLNESLQKIIDEHTEPWGIKVSVVEIKDVEIPGSMQQALARQAEAERNRRAKVINAEGEFQAAAKLAEAAGVIQPNPVTLQLRYLQALTEISGNEGSTIVFPIPLDLIRPLLEKGEAGAPAETDAGPPALKEAARPALNEAAKATLNEAAKPRTER